MRRSPLALVVLTACSPFGESPSVPTMDGADAAVDADAPRDAAPPTSDASVGAACAEPRGAGVVFCADFEGAETSGSFGWNGKYDPGGAFAIADAPERPGTKALRATLRAGNGSRNLFLYQPVSDVPPRPFRVVLDADVRIEAMPLEYAALAMVAGRNGTFTSFSGAAVFGGNGALGAIPPPDAKMTSPATGWFHTTTTVTVSGTSHRRVVALGGQVVQDQDVGAFPDGTTLDVDVGIFFTSAEAVGDAVVWFDDVVVHVEPG